MAENTQPYSVRLSNVRHADIVAWLHKCKREGFTTQQVLEHALNVAIGQTPEMYRERNEELSLRNVKALVAQENQKLIATQEELLRSLASYLLSELAGGIVAGNIRIDETGQIEDEDLDDMIGNAMAYLGGR